MVTKSRIVRIGNSRGVRVPKHLLDEANLPDEVEIRAEPGRLIVSAVKLPRDGWADAANAMHRHGDDVLLDDYQPTAFDEIEWQW